MIRTRLPRLFGALAIVAVAALGISAVSNSVAAHSAAPAYVGRPMVAVSLPAATPTPVPTTPSPTAAHGADLVAQLVVNQAHPLPGSQITLTATYKNNGPAEAAGAEAKLELPAAATFVSAADAAPLTGCSRPAVGQAGGTFLCQVTLKTGESATITATVEVPATAAVGAKLTATASIAGVGDPVATNNSAAVTVAVGSADLALTLTDGLASIKPAQTVAYTVKLTNKGPSAVPAGVSVKFVPGVATKVTAGGCTVAADHSVTCPTAGALASGATATFTISVVTAAKPGTKYTSSASVGSSPVFDPVSANNAASDVNAVEVPATPTTPKPAVTPTPRPTATASPSPSPTPLPTPSPSAVPSVQASPSPSHATAISDESTSNRDPSQLPLISIAFAVLITLIAVAFSLGVWISDRRARD